MGVGTALAPVPRTHCNGVERPSWFPDWSGQVCAIVASGPSVRQDGVDRLKGRCRVIVVNNNHELAPWADVLYAADVSWWDRYPDALKFAGLKITQDVRAADRHKLNRVYLTDEKPHHSIISIDRLGWVARGGNGGFQAINLAVQFGSLKHLWVGFDFCDEHWHGKHPSGMVNPRKATLAQWSVILDKQAPVLASLGVDVVNCSAVSALTAYKTMSIDEALMRFENVG